MSLCLSKPNLSVLICVYCLSFDWLLVNRNRKPCTVPPCDSSWSFFLYLSLCITLSLRTLFCGWFSLLGPCYFVHYSVLGLPLSTQTHTNISSLLQYAYTPHGTSSNFTSDPTTNGATNITRTAEQDKITLRAPHKSPKLSPDDLTSGD